VPDDIITSGVRTIRHRRRLMWILLLGSLPAYGVMQVAFSEPGLAGYAGVCLIVAYVISAGFAAWSRCPKCGGLFNRTPRGAWNPYTQRCLNCGLPLRTRRAA
jgi:hypothetical protein